MVGRGVTEPGEPVVIRRAAPADAATLTAFARQTFDETFTEGNDPDDLAAFLDASFQVPLQLAEIINPDEITLLVEDDRSLIGYAQVRRDETPAQVTGPAPVQLHRIYLAAAAQGRGLGRRLMEAAQASGRDLGGRTLWLTVWEHNQRAIAFYERFGFGRVGTADFVVGTEVQTDFLMAIAL